MKVATIKVGMNVKVRRGYSVRPAVVMGVRSGRVSVRFTDTSDAEAAAIGATNRANYFGADVAPNQVTPA